MKKGQPREPCEAASAPTVSAAAKPQGHAPDCCSALLCRPAPRPQRQQRRVSQQGHANEGANGDACHAPPRQGLQPRSAAVGHAAPRAPRGRACRGDNGRRCCQLDPRGQLRHTLPRLRAQQRKARAQHTGRAAAAALQLPAAAPAAAPTSTRCACSQGGKGCIHAARGSLRRCHHACNHHPPAAIIRGIVHGEEEQRKERAEAWRAKGQGRVAGGGAASGRPPQASNGRPHAPTAKLLQPPQHPQATAHPCHRAPSTPIPAGIQRVGLRRGRGAAPSGVVIHAAQGDSRGGDARSARNAAA